MTAIQEIQKKKEEKNKVLESTRKLFDVRKDIIGFFKKGFFRLKVMYLKQKKKNQKMNQKMNQKNNQKKNQKIYQIY